MQISDLDLFYKLLKDLTFLLWLKLEHKLFLHVLHAIFAVHTYFANSPSIVLNFLPGVILNVFYDVKNTHFTIS